MSFPPPTREEEECNDWRKIKLGRIFVNSDNYELDKYHNWGSHSICLAYLGDHATFIDKFEPMVDVLDDLEERLVFVADGARWIWNRIEECYRQATQILNFHHRVEHRVGYY